MFHEASSPVEDAPSGDGLLVRRPPTRQPSLPARPHRRPAWEGPAPCGAVGRTAGPRCKSNATQGEAVDASPIHAAFAALARVALVAAQCHADSGWLRTGTPSNGGSATSCAATPRRSRRQHGSSGRSAAPRSGQARKQPSAPSHPLPAWRSNDQCSNIPTGPRDRYRSAQSRTMQHVWSAPRLQRMSRTKAGEISCNHVSGLVMGGSAPGPRWICAHPVLITRAVSETPCCVQAFGMSV